VLYIKLHTVIVGLLDTCSTYLYTRMYMCQNNF